MKKHQLNIEQSKAVFEYCKRHLQMKMCYNNVFECVTDYMSNFRSGKWKIAYGYVNVTPCIYCRHCFILDENDRVIDPTIFTKSNPTIEDNEYLVMALFDDVDEYLTAIENENYMPALEKHFREQDKEAQQWALKKGLMLIG